MSADPGNNFFNYFMTRNNILFILALQNPPWVASDYMVYYQSRLFQDPSKLDIQGRLFVMHLDIQLKIAPSDCTKKAKSPLYYGG